MTLDLTPEAPRPAPASHSDTPLIRVGDLDYTVAGRALLRRVELHLRAGELLVVLGRNGAGKSTLLKHLTGELGTRGVELFGQPLPHLTAAQVAKRRAALAQHTSISFAYEVLDVVLLGRFAHSKRETAYDREVAAACLRRVGLDGFETRDIQTLSGGEQQRVHLARALAQLHHGAPEAGPGLAPPPSRVLLLDEPTASLDLAHQHATLRLARELCREGVGVLAILHDLNLAAQYADRVLLLSGGEVLACDTPQRALTSERIYAAYEHQVMVTAHPCLDCPLIVSAR